jgi:hypothetical protein
VIGALAPELDGEPGDLQIEVVDELEAGVDRAPPWVGQCEAVEQFAAGIAEQTDPRSDTGARRSSMSRGRGS